MSVSANTGTKSATNMFAAKALTAAATLALTLAMTPAISKAQVEVDLPLGVGLRIPQYDRVNGLTLPFGPNITIGAERLVLEPTVAYRSHLGALDLSLKSRFRIDSTFSITLQGGRGTFSNERWIRSDIMNSIWSFAFGQDSRNYFRADRGEAQLDIKLGEESDALRSELYVGSLWENAWSTGSRPGERNAPYSLFGRTDSIDGMRRPNPLINRGHIASAIAGGKLTYERSDERLKASFNARIESAFESSTGREFTQFTLTHESGIQTFLGQSLETETHFVTTIGDATPAQRFSYIGGSGTMQTLDALSLGGDRLFYVDTRYRIPVPIIELPFLGSPYVAPRFVIGAANFRKFGKPAHEIGLRAGAGFLWLQYMRNPRTDRDQFSGGFSIPR